MVLARDLYEVTFRHQKPAYVASDGKGSRRDALNNPHFAKQVEDLYKDRMTGIKYLGLVLIDSSTIPDL